MKDDRHDIYAERLRTALDLAETGIQMYFLQLKRRYPDATEDDLRARLRAWLHHRPGAHGGDTSGKPVELSTILAS